MQHEWHNGDIFHNHDKKKNTAINSMAERQRYPASVADKPSDFPELNAAWRLILYKPESDASRKCVCFSHIAGKMSASDSNTPDEKMDEVCLILLFISTVNYNTVLFLCNISLFSHSAFAFILKLNEAIVVVFIIQNDM